MTVLFGLALLVLLNIVGTVLVYAQKLAAAGLLLSVLIGILVSYQWLRRGRVYLATLVAMFSIWFVFSILIAFTGRSFPAGALGYTFVCAITGLLLGSRAAFIALTASAAVLVGLAGAVAFGHPPPQFFPAEPGAVATVYLSLLLVFIAIQTSHAASRASGGARASERQYQLAIEQAVDGILITDVTGHALMANSALRTMLGVTPEEIRDLTILDTYVPKERDAGIDRQRRLEAGEHLRFERSVRRKDGTIIPVEVTASRLNDGRLQGIFRDISERKRAEHALRESQDRFNRLSAAAFEGIAITDEGRLVDMNPQFAAMLGFEIAELIGRPVMELVAPEHRALVLGHIQSRSVERYEHTALRKDGTHIPVEVQGRIIPFEGRHLRVTAIQDLSARKVAEEKLRATETERQRAEAARRTSEEMFSRVFMSAPVGIVVSNLASGLLVDVNEEFIRLLGYRRDELIGHKSLELGVWPDPRARDELVARLQSKGESYDDAQRLVAKDGTIITVRAASHVLELDGVQHLLSAFIDITDLKRAEAELRHSEQLYRELVDGVRDVVVAMTPDGTLTALNPVFEQITGMPRTQWIGQSFLGLLDPRDAPRALALFRAALADTPRPVTQLRVRTAEGGARLAEIVLTPQRRHGTVVGLIGIARDVTDRVQLEEEFRQAQKMESVGRLAGGVAHDFNNIIMVIQATAGFLLEELAPEDHRRDDVIEIANAAQRAATLTRQLLAFSRKQVLELQVLDLNSVVRSLDQMLRRVLAANIDLSLQLGADLDAIKADPNQVDQVIMNLVVNARDAMPGGGTILLKTSNLPEAMTPVPNQAGTRAGPGVMLSIIDTGVGMDAETKSHLFEPFFTTKPPGQGTGLGLATVYGIVEQLGGTIRVSSEVGLGTSVDITFPSDVDSIRTNSPAVFREEMVKTRGLRILLVEDEGSVRDVIRRQLEQHHFVVTEAVSGNDALEQLRHTPGAVDLVLSDTMMPGITGLELRQRLRQAGSTIPVLLMSGYTDMAIHHTGEDTDLRPRIEKPFTPEQLVARIEEVLQGARDQG